MHRREVAEAKRARLNFLVDEDENERWRLMEGDREFIADSDESDNEEGGRTDIKIKAGDIPSVWNLWIKEAEKKKEDGEVDIG